MPTYWDKKLLLFFTYFNRLLLLPRFQEPLLGFNENEIPIQKT